jgi:hypothetical protein
MPLSFDDRMISEPPLAGSFTDTDQSRSQLTEGFAQSGICAAWLGNLFRAQDVPRKINGYDCSAGAKRIHSEVLGPSMPCRQWSLRVFREPM